MADDTTRSPSINTEILNDSVNKIDGMPVTGSGSDP